MQLELPFMADLPPENKIAQLDYSVNSLHESFHRVRRKLFANDAQTLTMLNEISERIAIIERNICRNQ
jgi:hypothetical protein